MTINNNSVEQINVALLDIDKKIKRANNANDLKNLEASVDGIKKTLNETAAGLESGKTYNINISGNAATATKANNANHAETATTAETAINANHAETATTAETAINANHAETATTAETATNVTKLANALTVNGKTYDGSSAVDAGVQAIANGGTGASNGQDAFDNIASGVRTSSNPLDNETMLFHSTSWYKTTCLDFWNYIKGKISSKLVIPIGAPSQLEDGCIWIER